MGRVISNLEPVGTIKPFAGGTIPDGYLPCDGTLLVNTNPLYVPIFNVIGTAFNIGGEPVNNFRTPDLRGRSPIGDGLGIGLTNRTIGSQTGTEAHQLTTAEMPSHDHGGASGIESVDHSHSIGGYSNGAGLAGGPFNYMLQNVGTANSSGGVSANHTHTVSAQGSGSLHNNMQPSLAIKFIIKY